MNRSVFTTTLIALICVCACDDKPPPPKATAKLGSRVDLAAGEVFKTTGAGKTRLVTGAMVEENAALEVGKGGRALIRLNNGAKVFLRESTVCALNEDTLDLTSGELWADVPPLGDGNMVVIRAGGVTVTAEDAGVDLAVKGDTVTVYAARGIATVSGPGGRAEVQSGEQATFAGRAAPKTEPVTFWEDWTGGLADRALFAGSAGRGAGTLYGIDRAQPGAEPEPLQITSQSIFVTVRNGLAHTVVDQRFFNPSSTPLEGFYWFTVPEGASVHRFSLEVNGALVEGEIVERKQAAAAYEDEVQRNFDPALLEWVDGRSFRARIFPIPAAGERRVVLSYFEMLPLSDGVYRYVYPMASSDATVQEFSLTVDLGEDGRMFDTRTQADAKVEADGSRVSIRRSGFRPLADFLLELVPKEAGSPMKVMRHPGGDQEADYVMVRYAPEVDWHKLTKVTGDVVVVLDTSAGGDEADRQVRQDTMEAILRALSDDDRFAVVTADLMPKVIYPEKGLAQATEKNVSQAVEKLAETASAGATDLGTMFSSALNLLHGAEQPAVVYVGDGNATVGETTSDALTERLRRSLGESRARLFTIAVGEDANLPLLDRLALQGGGRPFVISDGSQTVQEALRFVGMLKTPTLTNLHIDAGKGLDQVLLNAAGKISEGDEVILLARTHHALPKKIQVTGRLGTTDFKKEYDISEESDGRQGYIQTLWARQYLFELMRSGVEENRGRIISLGLNYSLMTPFTSFLVLESDDAYYRQGIQRRNRYRFSDLARKDLETSVAAADGLVIPLGLMGCAEKSNEALPPLMEERVERSAGAAPGVIPAKPAASEAAKTADQAPPPPPSQMPRPIGGLAGARGEGAAMDDELSSGNGLLKEKAMKKSGGSTSGKVRRRAEMPEEAEEAAPSPPSDKLDGKAYFRTETCSDASTRPLFERRMLWQRRLASAGDASSYYRVFMDAGKACELPTWRERKALLDLIDARVHRAEDVAMLLRSFAASKAAAKYLRNRILRRAFDPDQLIGDAQGEIYWPSFKAGLLAVSSLEEREKKLREFIARSLDHVQAREMLIELLIEQNKRAEAEKEAVRLRRDGAATPKVLELLCDLQAADKQNDTARRTCSELVEFNPSDPEAHERLGDMFLRHGWYQEAYRQYTGLVEMLKDVPFALLRLAAAAAGMGRTDEALRIERKVASGNGEAGPDDPRRIARLHSAVRLAGLLAKARKDAKTDAAAVERNLKRTQVFQGETTMAFVVWEDYQAAISVSVETGEKTAVPVERILSGESGLVMLDFGKNAADLTFKVAQSNPGLKREVPYTLLIVRYDGKTFQIEEHEGIATLQENVV